MKRVSFLQTFSDIPSNFIFVQSCNYLSIFAIGLLTHFLTNQRRSCTRCTSGRSRISIRSIPRHRAISKTTRTWRCAYFKRSSSRFQKPFEFEMQISDSLRERGMHKTYKCFRANRDFSYLCPKGNGVVSGVEIATKM